MNIEVTNRHENVLLSRVEIEVAITHDQQATPKRDELRDAVADRESTKAKLVIVQRMEPQFGRGHTRGFVHVYKDEEGLRRMEPHHLLVRHGMVEAQAEAPKEKAAAPKA
jgi:ribosomal protein S24E